MSDATASTAGFAAMRRLLPGQAVRAIDIGAGVGRDAAAPARRGHLVFARSV